MPTETLKINCKAQK